MPAKSTRTIPLLLNQNVESLGIVGDVVTVKPGYARNFLLPLGIAEAPTDERVESLKAARAEALAELEKVRGERKQIIDALGGPAVALRQGRHGLKYVRVDLRVNRGARVTPLPAPEQVQGRRFP